MILEKILSEFTPHEVCDIVFALRCFNSRDRGFWVDENNLKYLTVAYVDSCLERAIDSSTSTTCEKFLSETRRKLNKLRLKENL